MCFAFEFLARLDVRQSEQSYVVMKGIEGFHVHFSGMLAAERAISCWAAGDWYISHMKR